MTYPHLDINAIRHSIDYIKEMHEQAKLRFEETSDSG